MKLAFLNFSILITVLLLYNQAFCQERTDSDGVRIAWDYSSMQQLAKRGGYPRLTRLKDSTIIIIYESRTGNILIKKSKDNGLSWSPAEEVFSKFVYASLNGQSTVVNIANPEIKQLHNGDLVIACNYRPVKPEIAPYSIVIRRSNNGGETWLAPQNLYTAAPRFTDGCWEPSFLQLPNGELQVYFANENPYRESDEQEISMLSSRDNGITWSADAKQVSFRKNRRDGMPVPQLLGDEIVLVIEDNHVDKFKPYTVRTKIEDNWSVPVLANSQMRDYSLEEEMPDSVYMGAPYLLKLPGGETLISYQTNENRSKNWELSTMEVAVGNKEARNFKKRTQPFRVPLDKEAKWNSLALWDDQTVVALASSNFDSQDVAPWLIKGHIIPLIQLRKAKLSDYPIFIGSQGKTHLKGGLESDDQNLYIECKVVEPSGTHSVTDSSGIFLFVKLNNTQYKIWSSKSGKMQVWEKMGKTWQATSLKDKVVVTNSRMEDSYKICVTLSKALVKQKSLNTMALGLGLSAYDHDHRRYTEYLTNMEIDLPETWLNVEL